MNSFRLIRIAAKVVFYLLMIFTAYCVVVADMHPLAKITLFILILSACFFVREIDHAVEIDDSIPMSPEEEIMYREMVEEEVEMTKEKEVEV